MASDLAIYIVRHAEAAPLEAGSAGDDADRALTSKGEQQAQRVGQWLKHLGVTPDEVWTSPLLRARQTAAGLVEAWKQAPPVLADEALGTPGDLEALLTQLTRTPASTVVLVGHEPFLGALLYRLVGGHGPGSLPLGKGAIASVTWVRGHGVEGELVWLLNAKVLREMKGLLS